MAVKLKEGDEAPDFVATAIGGKYGTGGKVTLDDFRGAPLVLYFYPRDNTPGCTRQACGLRDVWNEIKSQAAIFGVSVDGPGSHKKFIEKFDLPFPLLSDVDRRIVENYGVWVRKKFLGKTYMGTERSTFIINGRGRIAAILRKVKPDEHVDLLRKALAGLRS
jgi:thioredoxin-dependent peroxiredoxin